MVKFVQINIFVLQVELTHPVVELILLLLVLLLLEILVTRIVLRLVLACSTLRIESALWILLV